MEVHPKGTRARVLLASVFGPYAQDDEFGSRRAINPMELYHNQVTRAQGAFSLRMFHRSWGIMMIQENISAPCTVLDFPTRADFARELTTNAYDIVGISSIIVNIGKVREMCRLVRKLSPHSVIVVGGHVAAVSAIESVIDADYVMRGEGIFDTGDELFDVMSRMEASLKVQNFFIMDQNFLLHRERAMQLLRRMKQAGKSWGIAVFASANAISKYTAHELVELGVSWVWMGLESLGSRYSKLQGTDTQRLTRELREHGIRVQGSTIIGLEHHTPENIAEEIENAIAHRTDFHQFMLYTPVPGTPLFKEMSEQGRMLEGIDLADIHGQYKFNFQHAAISRDDSKRFLDWAFRRDFEENGPSLYRMCRTLLQGWQRYKDYPDARVRERFARETVKLRTAYTAALWAMEKQFRGLSESVSRDIRALRHDVVKEFGSARIAAIVGGPLLLWTSRREEKRLQGGQTYEPPMFIERRNWGGASA